jgi:sec-independent protein translocase protein TatB
MGISPPIEAANLGMADSLILMVMALVVFGPRRLPQIGRQVGKLMFELRKASNDFKFQMEDELRKADEYDRQQQEEARKRAQEAQTAALAAPAPLAAAVTPDPYADLNPPATGEAPAAAAEPAAEPAVPAESTQTEETGLQVQPPSTGEIVAADRPGSSAGDPAQSVDQSAEAEQTTAADAAIGEPLPAAAGDARAEAEASEESNTEKAAEAETQAVTEPAAHHG